VVAGGYERVFPLFGPLREADWADGWDPQVVGAAPEPMRAGCVFRTRDAERGASVWVLTDYDEDRGAVRYVMVAPASHVARIAIDVRRRGTDATEAAVRYELTPLDPRGDDYVARMDDRRFAAWMDEWRAAIDHWLATSH